MNPDKSAKISAAVRHYALFLLGLAVASMGVAFTTKGGLGTSPVASVPYSVSLVSPLLSFGGWLNLLSVLQIITQVVILRGKCSWLEIAVQTVLAFVYGYLTDFSCWLIRGINVSGYPMQFAFMLLGCLILSFGIWIQLKGGVAMMPGEALNRAISKATGRKFGNVKIVLDLLYIAVAAVICLVFLGELKGVREGSIVAALTVGSLIKLFNRIYDRWFSGPEGKQEQTR